jgi:hypothetical protein
MERTKQEYKHLIEVYKERRKKITEEIKEVMKPYIVRRRRMSLKMKIWKRAVSRIEAREKRVKKLADQIYEFSGVRVKHSFPAKGRAVLEARSLFYKYGLESGLRAKELSAYTGCRSVATPSKCRRSFTRGMVNSKKLRDLWDRFNIHMDEAK